MTFFLQKKENKKSKKRKVGKEGIERI